MLKIRHNQIRKSIPVRQKTLISLKDLSLFLLGHRYQLRILELEIPSWNFRLNIEKINRMSVISI